MGQTAWLGAFSILVIALAAEAAPHSFVITAGTSFGPIRETTARAQLTRIFGSKSVEDSELSFPEAACTAGTVVYAGTPDAIEIGWQDQARTRVAFVRTGIGERGRWVTRCGVRVGTTLRQLVRLAGKQITFLGFGWDYSGKMTWREPTGSIEAPLRSHMDRVPEAAIGDRVVSSALPGLDLDKFDVAVLQQIWHDAWEYHDCHY